MRIFTNESFFLILAAIATQASPNPHNPSLRSSATSDPLSIQAINQPPTSSLQTRQIKVEGLAKDWSGVFTNFISCRPSIPIAATFIRFFRTASQAAIDAPDVGQQLRFSYGTLVLEIMSEDQITKEFVQATALYLLDAAQKGWTGLFEAWVKDLLDGSFVYVRLATIWDLPDAVSHSPWD